MTSSGGAREAGVSKDGHKPQRMGPSFETPASQASQDEVPMDSRALSYRKLCNRGKGADHGFESGLASGFASAAGADPDGAAASGFASPSGGGTVGISDPGRRIA